MTEKQVKKEKVGLRHIRKIKTIHGIYNEQIWTTEHV